MICFATLVGVLGDILCASIVLTVFICNLPECVQCASCLQRHRLTRATHALILQRIATLSCICAVAKYQVPTSDCLALRLVLGEPGIRPNRGAGPPLQPKRARADGGVGQLQFFQAYADQELGCCAVRTYVAENLDALLLFCGVGSFQWVLSHRATSDPSAHTVLSKFKSTSQLSFREIPT